MFFTHDLFPRVVFTIVLFSHTCRSIQPPPWSYFHITGCGSRHKKKFFIFGALGFLGIAISVVGVLLFLGPSSNEGDKKNKNIEMLHTPSCYKGQRANGEKGQRGWGHLSGSIAPTIPIKANIPSNSEQKGVWLKLPTGVRGLMRSKQAMKLQQQKHFKDEKSWFSSQIFKLKKGLFSSHFFWQGGKESTLLVSLTVGS